MSLSPCAAVKAIRRMTLGQSLGRCEQGVEVRQLRRLVGPGALHDAPAADEERRACGDVLQAAEIEGDAESPGRLGVPVGEEREIEVERLHPGDVRPRRVAGDCVWLYARRAKLLAPVTQELELARSGRRPVE